MRGKGVWTVERFMGGIHFLVDMIDVRIGSGTKNGCFHFWVISVCGAIDGGVRLLLNIYR